DTLTQIAVESIVAQEDLKRIDAGITNSQDYFAQLLKDVKGNANVSQSQIDSIMKKAQADINAAGGVKKLSVYDINKIMLAACGGVKGSEEKPHTAIDTIMQNIAQNIINSIPNEIKEDIKNFDMSNQSENKVLESNYFSAYKGSLVIRHDIEGMTSWGIFGTIFLNKSETTSSFDSINTVKHEYGHNVQEEELGLLKYIQYIAIPSVIAFNQNLTNEEYYSNPWERSADIFGGVDRKNYTEESWGNAYDYWKCITTGDIEKFKM
ncbi:MAG: hypothetical protein RR193_03310, partial [Christensenellaceae bacterium]